MDFAPFRSSARKASTSTQTCRAGKSLNSRLCPPAWRRTAANGGKRAAAISATAGGMISSLAPTRKRMRAGDGVEAGFPDQVGIIAHLHQELMLDCGYHLSLQDLRGGSGATRGPPIPPDRGCCCRCTAAATSPTPLGETRISRSTRAACSCVCATTAAVAPIDRPSNAAARFKPAPAPPSRATPASVPAQTRDGA